MNGTAPLTFVGPRHGRISRAMACRYRLRSLAGRNG
jgi:hypothetical protein